MLRRELQRLDAELAEATHALQMQRTAFAEEALGRKLELRVEEEVRW